MSVVVRDMEMPKNCFFCRFQNMNFCYAVYERSGEAKFIPNENLTKKPDWCPLFELKDWKEI